MMITKIQPGDCTFIGSVIRLRGGGSGPVTKVDGEHIHFLNLDGQSDFCYYDQIEYVCTP